jgi:hypothetical protein
METKKYIIQNLWHSDQTIEFINKDTTGLEDIWRTTWPKSKDKNTEEFRPMIFENKKTAQTYLREIKRYSKNDWDNNSHIHLTFGFRKPKWEIYEI